MPTTLQVLYPITDETRFDYDYYLSTHMALVGEHMGAHIDPDLGDKGAGRWTGHARGVLRHRLDRVQK